MEAQGIKEIVELIEGLKILGAFGRKVGADGMVNLADLPAVYELAQKAGQLTAAVQGLDMIPAEVKDLNAVEAQELLGALLAAVAAVKAA